MMTLILIGCAKKKQATRSRAADLYTSPLFRIARSYAEQQVERRSAVLWGILSAHYGLLYPNNHVEPYDLHLATQPAEARRAWGRNVAASLGAAPPEGGVIEVYAGRAYVDALRPPMATMGWRVVAPLDRIRGVGSRIRWFLDRIEAEPEPAPVSVPTAHTCPNCGHHYQKAS